MHEACIASIEEEPYCFLGHPPNFKVTRAGKSTIWIQFELEQDSVYTDSHLVINIT